RRLPAVRPARDHAARQLGAGQLPHRRSVPDRRRIAGARPRSARSFALHRQPEDGGGQAAVNDLPPLARLTARGLSMFDPKFASSNAAADFAALRERLHRAIPGGAHTYSRGDDQFPSIAPPILERGKGAYVYDPHGNRYLDYGMALRAITIGYADPRVNA